MARLTPDARIPRWIAAGYVALVVVLLAAAGGVYAVLEREARDRLAQEIEATVVELASRLAPEFRDLLQALPAAAGDPYSEALRPYFAEAVSVSASGERLFPPAVAAGLPPAFLADSEVVEKADHLAANGQELEALELYGVAANASSASVAWNALLGTAAVYERLGSAEGALPYLSRAATLPVSAELYFAARLRAAETQARIGQKREAALAHASLLEDVAELCASWRTAEPRGMSTEAVRLFREKATSALRTLGHEGVDTTLERIDESLLDYRRVEAMAIRLRRVSGGPGFVTVPGPLGRDGGPFCIFQRPRAQGGREAFRLEWGAWMRHAQVASRGTRINRVPLSFRLVTPAAAADTVAAPLGPPPLDGLLVEAHPATPGAVERSLAATRWRLGLGIGAVTALFLAGAGLGARNLARAAALSRARAEFALSTSHEIKTPLTLIRAAAETLATRNLDPGSRRSYLKTLVVESRRLSELVERVLDLRRLEDGSVEFERSPQNLVELAREAVETFAPSLRESDMVCELKAPEEVPVCVDPDTFVSALLALLENAVRYTPPDAPGERRRIDVGVCRDGPRGLIEIADRGIGIPPDERSRVLERYYRLRTPLHSKVRGAGLGLSIVRHIVESHGGSVRIEGRRPTGTRVRVWLPLEEDGDGES